MSSFTANHLLMKIALALWSLGCVFLAHGQQPSTPDTLGDQVADYWAKTPKWYLIITASSPNSRRFGKIAWVDEDGTKAEKLLRGLGYQPLSLPQPLKNPLKGDSVTNDNVKDAIAAIASRKPGDNEIVLIYFSGHGEPGGQGTDLQIVLNDGSEMTLTQLIRSARSAPASSEIAFRGQLIFLIDACDSGNGIWLTDLKKSETRLPTIVLGSSSVNEQSRKLRNVNGSAFTALLENGATSNWPEVDENEDGFLDYRELQQWAEVELSRLYKNKDIDGEMHPEGITDGPLFIAYDRTKDKRHNSVRRRQLLAEGKIAALIGNSATQIALRNGRIVGPSIPDEAKQLAALIQDDSDLTLAAKGYKALAEGRIGDARSAFELARQEAEGSFAQSNADLGLARTALFSGDFQESSKRYDMALGNTNRPFSAEGGVSALLAGKLVEGTQILASSYSIGNSKKEFLKSPQTGDVSVAGALALAYARQNDFKNAKLVLGRGVAASAKLEKVDDSFALRTAAIVYANAAEVSAQSGDRKDAVKFFKKSENLFVSLQDSSSERETMLRNYSDLLQKTDKLDESKQKSEQADGIAATNNKLNPSTPH